MLWLYVVCVTNGTSVWNAVFGAQGLNGYPLEVWLSTGVSMCCTDTSISHGTR